ncbi:hypothetical protein KDL45_00370 [bacterium]|nr:hypothetical protein [bacterium]MCB9479917.1 hypothetical protein [Deltaproteobacteria bacterium]
MEVRIITRGRLDGGDHDGNFIFIEDDDHYTVLISADPRFREEVRREEVGQWDGLMEFLEGLGAAIHWESEEGL